MRRMRYYVLGATRNTGLIFAHDALAAGHEVTACVRDPAKLPIRPHPSLKVVTGDVLAPSASGSLAEGMKGADVVVSTLGSSTGLEPNGIYSEGFKTIVAAMAAAGVPRLVVVTADHERHNPSFIYRTVVKPFVLNKIYADMKIGETYLSGGGAAAVHPGLQWTVVQPYRLQDKDDVRYRLNPGSDCTFETTRKALATFLLKEAHTPVYANKFVPLDTPK